MKNYQISEDLHNFCSTFENDVTKPQLNRFKELVHGIIVGKKANLSDCQTKPSQTENDNPQAGRTVQQHAGETSASEYGNSENGRYKNENHQTDTSIY